MLKIKQHQEPCLYHCNKVGYHDVHFWCHAIWGRAGHLFAAAAECVGRRQWPSCPGQLLPCHSSRL